MQQYTNRNRPRKLNNVSEITCKIQRVKYPHKLINKLHKDTSVLMYSSSAVSISTGNGNIFYFKRIHSFKIKFTEYYFDKEKLKTVFKNTKIFRTIHQNQLCSHNKR